MLIRILYVCTVSDLNRERQWSRGIGDLCIIPGTGTLAILNYSHLKINLQKREKGRIFKEGLFMCTI